MTEIRTRSEAEAIVNAHIDRRVRAQTAAAERTADDSAGDVKRLLGNEGHLWVVRTTHTRHLIDLDNGHIWRFPGPDATPGYGLGSGTLVSLDPVLIGLPARWHLYGGNRPEYHHVRTGIVLSIERVHDEADE